MRIVTWRAKVKAIAKQVTLAEGPVMVVQASVVEHKASPTELIEYVLHLCDVILVMTVNPGFGGQKFLPETLPKIRTHRPVRGRRDPPVCKDFWIFARAARRRAAAKRERAGRRRCRSAKL